MTATWNKEVVSMVVFLHFVKVVKAHVHTLLSPGGTLPFDDSIPSRSELRTRGFFKSLEKADGERACMETCQCNPVPMKSFTVD